MTPNVPRPATLALYAVCATGCGHASVRTSAEPSAATAEPRRDTPPSDGLEVSGTLGTVPEEKVQDTFARKRPEIEACYRAALGEQPWLGGHLGIKVRLAARGEVQAAWIDDALGQVEVEACVLRLVRAATFAPPEGGANAEFSWGLDLRGSQSTSPLGCDQVARAVTLHKAGLDKCTHGASASPLSLVLFVAPGGVVPAASAAADEQLDDAARECLAGEVRAWKFPDPRGKVARAACRFDNGALVP